MLLPFITWLKEAGQFVMDHSPKEASSFICAIQLQG